MVAAVAKSRVLKARIIGGPEFKSPTDLPSKQLIEDPFESLAGIGSGVTTEPPYSLEQLVVLAESHPIHGAALEQKAIDAVGSGPVWVPDDSEYPDEEQKKEIIVWLDSLPEHETFVEILQAAQVDYGTVGWGTIEVARGPDGIVKHLWHIPGHTVRAHKDNMRFVQARQGKAAWFKRWGVGLEEKAILLANGRTAPEGTSYDKQANEILILKRASRRSTWYGIPNYVSAIGHIALAIAARDYNVKFFANSREPRLIFIVSGLDATKVEEYLDELEQSLRTQHNEPHRNLILPMTGNAEIRIETVTAVSNDLQFAKLMDQTDKTILAAHRMPPDRVGATTVGALGGNAATSINRVYKDAVVGPEQLVLRSRLNTFIKTEFAVFKGAKRDKDGVVDVSGVLWSIDFDSVDLTDETVDTANTIARVRANLITMNEGREQMGLASRDDMDVMLAEWLSNNGGGGLEPVAASVAIETDLKMNTLLRQVEAMAERMEQIDELIVEELTGQDGDRRITMGKETSQGSAIEGGNL